MNPPLIFFGPLPVPGLTPDGLAMIAGVQPTTVLPNEGIRSPLMDPDSACGPFWRVKVFKVAVNLEVTQAGYLTAAQYASHQVITGNATLVALINPTYQVPPDPTMVVSSEDQLVSATGMVSLDGTSSLTIAGDYWLTPSTKAPNVSANGSIGISYYGGLDLGDVVQPGYYSTSDMSQQAAVITLQISGGLWADAAFDDPVHYPDGLSLYLSDTPSSDDTATFNVDLSSIWPDHKYTRKLAVDRSAGSGGDYYTMTSSGTVTMTAQEYWTYGGLYDPGTGRPLTGPL